MDGPFHSSKSASSIGISWGYEKLREDEVERARRIWEQTVLETEEHTSAEMLTDEMPADDGEASEGAEGLLGEAGMSHDDVLHSFAVKMNFTADMLLFTERLQVVRDGEVCGTVTLSTERLQNLPGTEELYSSHVTGPDYSVMALVSAWTLQTSSERRHGPGDSSTFMTNCDGSLHVVIRSSKEAQPTKWNLPKEVSTIVLGEGASLLLIRHLGASRFVGRVSLFAVLDGHGGLALQTLTSSRGSSDDATLVVRQVKPMRRHLPEFTVECEVTRAGQLLWYTRSPGEWWVRTDPRLRLYTTMRLGWKLPPLQTRWREDAQLSALYEQRVQLLAARYRRRLPELRPLLADFLVALLAARPLNAFSFAVDFFTAQAGTRPEDDRRAGQDNWETTAGLQYADALFYYEVESRRQEEMAREEEATRLVWEKRDHDSSAAQADGGAPESQPEASDFEMAKRLLSDELSRALQDQERIEFERREALRVQEERQLRASLFREAGFAELLVGGAADDAVLQVEAELRRREDCTFRVHPVSIRSDHSVVDVYHDQRYGDDFQGQLYEELSMKRSVKAAHQSK